MPTTLWQLYDVNGNPLSGSGATLWDTSVHALLHGAAHVWLWRPALNNIEVMVQERSANKLNWPSKFNKSAGGHILAGEDPALAAVRKLKQELELDVNASDLTFIGRCHWRAIVAGTELSENEYQWMYLLRHDRDDVRPVQGDVKGVKWISIDTFFKESTSADTYTPYGRAYYQMVYTALRGLRNNLETRENVQH